MLQLVIFYTGISIWLPVYRHWWQFCRQLRRNTSRLPILKCTPITVTQDVHYMEYTTSLLCNSSLGLSTWLEVIDFLLDTQCIQQTGYGWVGCTLRHMCSKLLTF